MIRVFVIFFLWALLASACVFIFNRSSYIWLISQARRRGLLPPFDKASLEDVKELLRAGERNLAIRVYGQMYHLNLKQAEREVDLLERNLDKHDKHNTSTG